MKKFTLSQKILLILFQGVDKRAMTYRPLSYIYRLLPASNKASVRTVCALLNSLGLIDKIGKDNKVLFAITDLGRKELTRALFNTRPSDNQDTSSPSPGRRGDTGGEVKWDKKLHLVIISVPEKEREKRQKIRSLLERYNYRIMQPGIWFCPMKNEELLKQLKEKVLFGYTVLIEAVNLIGISPKLLKSPKQLNSTENEIKELVIFAYQLDLLQESYEKYLRESSVLQKMIHFDTSRYINLLNLQEFLLTTVGQDPFFPDDYLELSNLRQKCREMFLSLCLKTLLPEKEEKL